MTDATGAPLASAERAAAATDAEHAAAIASTRCTICGAAPGTECTYGAFGGQPAGQHFPGRAHTRRVRACTWCLTRRGKREGALRSAPLARN